MASCASSGVSYRVDAVACHECGRPLPPALLLRLATDADGADVVARVRNGSINQVNCPHCDCSGWIAIPFLWLDRARLRAVFVDAETRRHDLVAAEREELLALALAGMDESQQQIVLSRLQEVAAYREIPAALARSDDEAHGEHAGLLDFLAREGLPAAQRLERLLGDAHDRGVVLMRDFEATPAFHALIRHESGLLDPADNSFRAVSLRQILAVLPAVPAPVADVPAGAMARPDDRPLAIFADMLEAEEASRLDDLLDDLLQVAQRDDFLAALAPTRAELDGLIACAASRLARAQGGQDLSMQRALEDLLAAAGRARALAGEAPPAPQAERMHDVAALMAIAGDAAAPPPQRLGALESMARQELNTQRYHDAAASAKRLVDLARALGDREALARGLFFTGSALVELHNANASLIYFQEANALLSDATLSRQCAETLAHVYEKAGDAYVQLTALPLAAKAYQASAGLFHQLGRSDGEHSTLERLAGVCSQLGQATLAQTHYRAALACVPPESEAAVRTLCNLGDMLGALASRPDTVLEIAFGGPPSGSDADQSASWHRGDAQADAAARQEDQLDFVQGLDGMEQGRVIFRVHEAAGGRPSLLFESIVGDEAVRCLLDARRLARAQGYAELELLTYAQLANLFIAYGMRRAACDSVEIGRRRCAELGQQPSTQALHAMAVVHEDAASQACMQGAADEARDSWSACLDLCNHILARVEKYTDAAIYATGLKALCLEGLGRLAEAVAFYRAAIARFENRRRHLEQNEHKLKLQASSAILYPRAARNLLALRRQGGAGADIDMLAQQAYGLAEAAHARILLDACTPDSGPAGAVFLSRAVVPMSAVDLAAGLPAATAIVQYALLPSYAGRNGCWALFLILPGHGGVPLLVEHGLEDVFDAVAAVNAEIMRIEESLMAAQGHGAVLSDQSALDAVLERLGSLLLPDSFISAVIAHGIDRLVFVPEGYLMQVPFAALRANWGGKTSYACCGEGRLTEILVMPSASLFLASWRKARAPSRAGLLCISDPGGDLDGVAGWMDERFGTQWLGMPVVHLAGADARRTTIEDAFGACDSVLYVGHGRYDQQNPANSGLLLHDGLFSASRAGHPEVAQRLSGCRLFVIMACSGARVDDESAWAAREVQGLTMQLLGAGVDDVIGGIWLLSSSLAEDFVDRLFARLEQGDGISAAYARTLAAIVAAGGAHAHPYLWGGLRLSGAGSSRASCVDC